jgi:hypothetical protein
MSGDRDYDESVLFQLLTLPTTLVLLIGQLARSGVTVYVCQEHNLCECIMVWYVSVVHSFMRIECMPLQ